MDPPLLLGCWSRSRSCLAVYSRPGHSGYDVVEQPVIVVVRQQLTEAWCSLTPECDSCSCPSSTLIGHDATARAGEDRR
jgi:hypothetical protein